VLSFFWCGLGHIYNGQILKGILMVIGYPMCWWFGMVFLFFGAPGLAAAPDLHNDALATGYALGLLAGVGTLIAIPILWIYGIVNAYRATERRNRQTFYR
jgi:hypothetical protein